MRLGDFNNDLDIKHALGSVCAKSILVFIQSLN